MVTEKRKRNTWLSGAWTRRALVAACVAAGFGIGGCDSSTSQAQKDAAEAARRAASAGEPRATDKLYQQVEGTSPEDMNKLRTEVEAKVKGSPDGWKEYIEQQSAEKDLAKANELIESALKVEDPAFKSVFGAEAGDTELQMANAKSAALQDKLTQLAQQALILQDVTQTPSSLGAEADALATLAKAPAADDVEKIRSQADASKAAVAKAQSEVDRIQKDISAKQDQARQVYAQTDADFKAAEALAGKAAIDAGNKAMEVRKQADTLTAQAAAEDADLAKARSDLDIATIQQKENDVALADATAASDMESQWAKGNADRVASLRDQARKVIQDALAERYKTFVTLANSLDADIKSAAQSAGQAGSAYAASGTQWQSAQQGLSSYASSAALPNSDPIKLAAADARTGAILNWSQSAASGQAGRINAAGYAAAGIANAIAGQVAEAYKHAGMADAPAKSTLDADAYKTAAVAAFTAAASSAKSGTDKGGGDMDKIKWIGYGLQAIAQQGLSLVADKAMADTARAAAKDAGAKAIDGNPDMRPQMEGLAVGI